MSAEPAIEIKDRINEDVLRLLKEWNACGPLAS